MRALSSEVALALALLGVGSTTACGSSTAVDFYAGIGGGAGSSTSTDGAGSTGSGASAGQASSAAGGGRSSGGTDSASAGDASSGASGGISGGPSATPCSPVTDGVNGMTGPFGTTGPYCLRVRSDIVGWGCSNFQGRTLKVNGTPVACAELPLPDKLHGDYYFDVSAGEVKYASMFWY